MGALQQFCTDFSWPTHCRRFRHSRIIHHPHVFLRKMGASKKRKLFLAIHHQRTWDVNQSVTNTKRVFLLIEFKTIAVSAVLIIERKFRPFFITGSSGGYTQLPGLFTGFVRLKGKSSWRWSELCPKNCYKQIVRHKKNDDKRSPLSLFSLHRTRYPL